LALTSRGQKFDAQYFNDLRDGAGREDVRLLSLSGHERNHLFFSAQAEKFNDLAGISGLDHPGDSRSFAILDYDRDGWQDIAMVNSNAPLLRFYRNSIGAAASAKNSGHMIALRFVGGNKTAQFQPARSNRDGYGLQVQVKLGERAILREHRAGEGFAAQNSATMIIGIGERTVVDSLIVRWPSRIIQKTGPVPEGMLVTVYEDPAQQPQGQTFVMQPYRVSISPRSALVQRDDSRPRLRLDQIGAKDSRQALRVYTTMATWCAKCKGELPQVARLRDTFDKNQVGLFGLPVDETDGPNKLKAYLAKHKPAYELITGLSVEQVAAVKQIVMETLKLDGLPATIVTDSEGNILRTMWGVPSVSEVRQWLKVIGQ